MHLIVNTKDCIVSDDVTINSLMESQNTHWPMTAWVNGNQVPYKEQDTYELKDGDVVKIVRLVGGG